MPHMFMEGSECRVGFANTWSRIAAWGGRIEGLGTMAGKTCSVALPF